MQIHEDRGMSEPMEARRRENGSEVHQLAMSRDAGENNGSE